MPLVPFFLTIKNYNTDLIETVKVTLIVVNILTVERGQSDTTARSHLQGEQIELRVMAEHIQELQDHVISANNPHSVTKSQIGLSNVVNADTTNADNINDGIANAIITKTQETNFETAYTHSQIIVGNPHQLSVDDLTDAINVARRNTANNYTGNQTIAGDLTVNGNIIQSGETYITYAQEIRQKNDLIITRDGAISGLANGQYTGIQAKLYNGVDDGQLVFSNDGFARVGDVGDLQILATRQDVPTANGIAYWNNTLKRFDTNSKLTYDGSELSLDGILTLEGSGTFAQTSKGVSFFYGNDRYKIGFDDQEGAVGNLRYMVDASDIYHGHMFSAGSWDSIVDLLYIRGDKTLMPYGNVNIPSGFKYKINSIDLSASDVGAATSDHNHSGVYESVFSKNTAFNKNFGILADTVAEGNHSHGSIYEPANANIQTHISSTSNPHVVTREQLSLATTDSPSFTGLKATDGYIFGGDGWPAISTPFIIAKPDGTGNGIGAGSAYIKIYDVNQNPTDAPEYGGTGFEFYCHKYGGGTNKVLEVTANKNINVVDGKVREYGNDLVPVGIISMWSGLSTAIPAGYVLCDGEWHSAMDGGLVLAPDMRGKFVAGYMPSDPNFGYVTGEGGSLTHDHNYSVGDVTRDTDNAPAIPGTNQYHTYRDNQLFDIYTSGHLPPYFVICYIMKV